jgi:flagellar basal-body rod protein FlgG
MTSQQLNVDTISNNIANVNTTGYKRDRMEFKTLLYQTLERASLDETDTGRPVNLQVGLGVRPVATAKIFSNGAFQSTENPLDFAIEGDGFFVIDRSSPNLDIEQIVYTRDGSFKLSVEDDGNYLVTSDGCYVLDSDGERIMFPSNLASSNITLNSDGTFSYPDPDDDEGEIITTETPLQIVQFPNNQGLESIGNNYYIQTTASGEPLIESEGDTSSTSRIVQNYLEMSNVNIAEEMVNLIVAQRAYELNSKAITTSDEMLQQANNLKK